MSKQAPIVRFGFPKGSLEEATIQLFAKAGWNIRKSSRSYKPSIDDDEIEGRFVRGQEISRYVDHGYFDVGLCGYDWIVENGSEVVEVRDLVYSRASNRPSYWVLAVPEDSEVRSVKDLNARLRVGTCRLLVGADHRFLTPATFLFGGVFLAGCDTLTRVISGWASGAELPVGVLTALLGGPFFILLLLNRKGGLEL